MLPLNTLNGIILYLFKSMTISYYIESVVLNLNYYVEIEIYIPHSRKKILHVYEILFMLVFRNILF